MLALLGLVLLKARPTFGRICIGAGLASLWLLSTPIVSDALTGLVELYPPLDFRQAAQRQAIVILGGGGERAFAPEYGGPAAEPLLLERLSYGAYIAKKTGLPVLVTGISLEAARCTIRCSEILALRRAGSIRQAYDTFENARNSARILTAENVHRIILVTRATHMRRAVQEFTAAGFDAVPAPVGMLAARDFGVLRIFARIRTRCCDRMRRSMN